jgi:hypothetical protein
MTSVAQHVGLNSPAQEPSIRGSSEPIDELVSLFECARREYHTSIRYSFHGTNTTKFVSSFRTWPFLPCFQEIV